MFEAGYWEGYVEAEHIVEERLGGAHDFPTTGIRTIFPHKLKTHVRGATSASLTPRFPIC